jgi:hypothetical protein
VDRTVKEKKKNMEYNSKKKLGDKGGQRRFKNT